MRVIERNVQEIGKSLLVTLPKGWADSAGIKKGTKLKMLISDQGLLTITPDFVEKNIPSESTIKADRFFSRKFIREYFNGCDKITILKDDKNQNEVHNYLRRFMNVQVIEDNSQKMVVKCFRIDDLSMEECLTRMFYLTYNLIGEKTDLRTKEETRETVTRFYYMLVMQVRRYLREGKFTDPKTVSIIRAMDIRIAAEKIQRMSEIVTSKNIAKNAAVIKEYYKKAFGSFLNEDFETALTLWESGNNLLKKLKGDERQVIYFAKEISMHIR